MDMRTAICAIAKNENDYILEWAEYHLGLGFDKIFVYDNNDPGDDSLLSVLGDLCASSRIEILDWRGRKDFQLAAYNDCYCCRADGFDWLAFIDIDEFVTFGPDAGTDNINVFLAGAPESADAVELNWMMFGDCGIARKGEGGVISRFRVPLELSNSDNLHVKTIARTGRSLKFEKNPHVMEGGSGLVVDDCFREVPESGPFKTPSYSRLYIRHYGTKTVEEFIRNKISRGNAHSSRGSWKYNLTLFYVHNLRTPEKREVEKEMLPMRMVHTMDFVSFLKRIGLGSLARKIRY